MAGRWNEERYNPERGEYYRRDEVGDAGERRQDEGRSFRPDDRVFGERESGAAYNRPSRGNWQDRDFAGVSPAMRRGDYGVGPRFQSQDYTRGGRYYGDDSRDRIYREEYGQGGREYGPVPRGYDAGGRFGAPEADARWAREMRRPGPVGPAKYDARRGYDQAPDRDDHEGFEDHARDAGDFFRRTGERISNWFSDVTGEIGSDSERQRSARGLGPKGYRRSDERISDDVHQRLTDDPWLDASDVRVAVSAGEVTLSGTVGDRGDKHRAEHIVEDVSGVTHVQNNLRVDRGDLTASERRQHTDSASGAALRADGDAAMQTSANAKNKT